MASQAVEDLLWTVNSTSFVTGDNVAPRRTLDASAIDCEALERFLGPDLPHRVGRYFEALTHFWLANIRGLEMVGAGLQILDGKRTVGEVDFLYRDEHDKLTHCETAVKFYLHHPRKSGSHFPGPNAVDDYERKTIKLFTQQLGLSKTHFPEVSQRHAFVKGMVFYHHAVPAPTALPAHMPADHARGSWIRWGELTSQDHGEQTGVAVAHKPHWLAPQLDADIRTWPQARELLADHFATRGHPLMLSVRDATSLREVDRKFVVSNTWPERA